MMYYLANLDIKNLEPQLKRNEIKGLKNQNSFFPVFARRKAFWKNGVVRSYSSTLFSLSDCPFIISLVYPCVFDVDGPLLQPLEGGSGVELVVIVDVVEVDLVREYRQVVVYGEIPYRPQLLLREHCAGRIVRVADEYGFRLEPDAIFQSNQIRMISRPPGEGRDGHLHAQAVHDPVMAHEGGRPQQDLVALIQHRPQGDKQGCAAACGGDHVLGFVFGAEGLVIVDHSFLEPSGNLLTRVVGPPATFFDGVESRGDHVLRGLDVGVASCQLDELSGYS